MDPIAELRDDTNNELTYSVRINVFCITAVFAVSELTDSDSINADSTVNEDTDAELTNSL
jgi:hypothetical protein